MNFIPVDPENPMHVRFLYSLYVYRPIEARISSTPDLTMANHQAYVRAHPYRYWWLIQAPTPLDLPPLLGSIYIGNDNSIGIAVHPLARGRGHGTKAVQYLLDHYDPLPAISGVRRGEWIANVAPGNERARLFFARLGFEFIQVTYARTGRGGTS